MEKHTAEVLKKRKTNRHSDVCMFVGSSTTASCVAAVKWRLPLLPC